MGQETGWSEKGAWAVVWQKEKQGFFVEFLLPYRVANLVRALGLRRSADGHYTTFGLSETAESAMEKVEERLKHDPEFLLRWSGGAFRPVPYHLGVHVTRRGQLRLFPEGKEF